MSRVCYPRLNAHVSDHVRTVISYSISAHILCSFESRRGHVKAGAGQAINGTDGAPATTTTEALLAQVEAEIEVEGGE